jgi:Fungal specific transcription factor domain
MHHYSTCTVLTLHAFSHKDVLGLWKADLPRLAFQHDFLMNCLLGITSLHLGRLRPDDVVQHRQTVIYQQKAVKSFRMAILNISIENFQGILATSMLITILSLNHYQRFAACDGLWLHNWLGLHCGIQSLVHHTSKYDISQTPFEELFRTEIDDGKTEPVLPTILSEMLDNPSSLALSPLDRQCIETTLQLLGRIFDNVEKLAPEKKLFFEILSWPYRLPKRFVAMVSEYVPQALVILAYYAVFLEFRNFLWAEGIAKLEVGAIRKALCDNDVDGKQNTQWLAYIAMPLKAIQIRDSREVLGFLRAELPTRNNSLEQEN